MRRKWTTFRRLSAAERRLFLQAAVLLPLTAGSLRLMGFRRTQSLLERLAPLPPRRRLAGPAAEAQARAAQCMVRLAATRGLTRPLCLPRSLALCALLHRDGIDAQLRIGVDKQGEDFSAHAWVEAAGLILDDFRNTTTRFAAFDALGGALRAGRFDHGAASGGQSTLR